MTNIIKYETEQQEFDHLKSLAKVAASSKQYADVSEVQLLNLMMSARDLGISPMKAINGGFHIIKGKVCMSTALMADRIRKAGHSIKVIEMNATKCVIIGVRKDNGDSLKLEYTMEEAKLADLHNSMTWKKYPKAMLYNRCMSQMAKILFPDVVGNSYSEEERYDIQNIPPEERPLEDADGEIVMPEVATQKLSEEQCTRIDQLLLQLGDDEDKIEKFISKRLRIENVFDMPLEKYEGVVSYLEKLISEKEKKDGSRVA